tara:strand:+ start:770 stop:1039 length:270 start_codon:yes stop_codon:yes gene_type:complete
MIDAQQALNIAISLVKKDKEVSDYGYAALQDAAEALQNLKDQDSVQRGLEGSLIDTDPNYLYMPVSRDSLEMQKTSEPVKTPPTGAPPL